MCQRGKDDGFKMPFQLSTQFAGSGIYRNMTRLLELEERLAHEMSPESRLSFEDHNIKHFKPQRNS